MKRLPDDIDELLNDIVNTLEMLAAGRDLVCGDVLDMEDVKRIATSCSQDVSDRWQKLNLRLNALPADLGSQVSRLASNNGISEWMIGVDGWRSSSQHRKLISLQRFAEDIVSNCGVAPIFETLPTFYVRDVNGVYMEVDPSTYFTVSFKENAHGEERS